MHKNQLTARTGVWLAVALCAIAGCRDGASQDILVQRDSAGVVITENEGPSWGMGDEWSLDPTPIFSIGTEQGDATEQLYGVTSVLVASDTIIVVNGGTAEVRWYDKSGAYIRSVGGAGAGPGEFSRYGPGAACATADGRLVVADPVQRRANVFSGTGSFLNVIAVQADAAFPSIQGCFSDGSLLGWRSIGPKERPPGTVIETEFEWSRVQQDGTTSNVLATLPGARQYLLDQGNGRATYHSIPFTVRPSAAVDADALYITEGTAPVLNRLGLDGRLLGSIRWNPPRTRSVDAYDQYRSATLEDITDAERRVAWERFFDLRVPMPEHVPVVRAMLVDDEHNVWLERYRLPDDSIRRWEVFSHQGRWLGTVDGPRDVEPMTIGNGLVIGVHKDSLDVERVRGYRIVRPHK